MGLGINKKKCRFFILKIVFKTYVIEQILQEETIEKRQTKEQEN